MLALSSLQNCSWCGYHQAYRFDCYQHRWLHTLRASDEAPDAADTESLAPVWRTEFLEALGRKGHEGVVVEVARPTETVHILVASFRSGKLGFLRALSLHALSRAG